MHSMEKLKMISETGKALHFSRVSGELRAVCVSDPSILTKNAAQF
jgi:hypothetical protein